MLARNVASATGSSRSARGWRAQGGQGSAVLVVPGGLHIASSSGTNLSGSVNVPATGGWQTWTTVTATVTLPAGLQTLTIYQDNGGWKHSPAHLLLRKTTRRTRRASMNLSRRSIANRTAIGTWEQFTLIADS
jgi:hypothetical protein